MADFVGAVDQGTKSTRFMVFDHEGNEVARHQLDHQQVLPRPGRAAGYAGWKKAVNRTLDWVDVE